MTERIAKEAERLARIVDDLLDLSLIETQEAPRRSPTPLELLVDDAVDQLRPAAAAAGINLQVHPGVTGALVACDRRQVVSAIANLIDNAVKYSEPGSPVTVSTALVGAAVEVAVRDDGIGIPSRDLERIFERFYRVDQARSRATGGTGLGLAIVRHVAQCPRWRRHRGIGRRARIHVPVRAAVRTRVGGRIVRTPGDCLMEMQG